MSDELGKKLLDDTDGEAELTKGDEAEAAQAAPAQSYDKTSVTVLASVGLVDAIEYGVVMPSLYKYMNEIAGVDDSSTATYGLVIASFSVSSMLSKPIIGRWCDRRSFREVYCATIVIAIAGNVAYALAGHYELVALVFAGRLLSGVGCANTSLVYAYVSRTVPKDQVSGVMMKVGLTFPLGLVIGPATNLITVACNFTVGGYAVRDTNAPGLLLALVLSVLLAAIMLNLKEPPSYDERLGTPADSDTVGGGATGGGGGGGGGEVDEVDELLEPPPPPPDGPSVISDMMRPSVALCFGVIFFFNLFIGASEAVVVPVTQAALDFSPLQNSFVYGGIAFYILVLTMVIITQGKRFEDRTLVLAACVIYACGATAAMFLWRYEMPLWKFLLGELALITAVPMAFSPNRALFSKEVAGSRHQALLSSLLSVTASLGSIAGPLWMGMTVSDGDDDNDDRKGAVGRTMFLGVIGAAVLLVVLVVTIWFWLFPPGAARATKPSQGDARPEDERPSLAEEGGIQ